MQEKTEFIKDFDKWNNYKKLIEQKEYIFKFHEGDIWNCYIGENVGYEECGKNDFLRPVLILWKVSNKGFIGIPTSTKDQLIDDWYVKIKYIDRDGECSNNLLITQIRFYDAKRLAYCMGKTNKPQLKEVRRKLGVGLKILEKIDPSTKTDRGLGAFSTAIAVALILTLLYQIF